MFLLLRTTIYLFFTICRVLFVCCLRPLKIQFVLINRLSGPVSLAYMCRDLCVLSVYFLLVIFKRLTCLGASLMALHLNRWENWTGQLKSSGVCTTFVSREVSRSARFQLTVLMIKATKMKGLIREMWAFVNK